MYALAGLLLRTLVCGKIYQILLNLATKSKRIALQTQVRDSLCCSADDS
jgi:hypothetical protein